AEPEDLPLSRDTVYDRHGPIPWCEGSDLMGGEPTWVPFELVHANATLPAPPGSGCFVRGSNGLASGNTFAEATLHGLCELVERDALALWQHRTQEYRDGTRVDLASVDDSTCHEVLGLLAVAGGSVGVWNLTADVQVAAFRSV